ncbi:hypothetical protein P167DRAFT_550264 [Morchella conica CCBAS932]|uniref:Uncharacterized protein n=1 Tax=Morchella conica CCBAS932 TaxID=1392247 RepID=A0A3N4KBG8_9PEZI|nr:hypothetical protein P167DRAFT_550264 [Morchella conica CCBAS932]
MLSARDDPGQTNRREIGKMVVSWPTCCDFQHGDKQYAHDDQRPSRTRPELIVASHDFYLKDVARAKIRDEDTNFPPVNLGRSIPLQFPARVWATNAPVKPSGSPRHFLGSHILCPLYTAHSRRQFTREVSWADQLSQEVLNITDNGAGFLELISLNILQRLFSEYTAKKCL